MRLNKKLLIVPVLALAVIGTGTAFALQPNSTPNKQDNVKLSSETQKEAAGQVPEEITAPAEEVTQSTPPTPEPTPIPQPAYGEDPNNPGTYLVFDKAKVMTEAGIPADQHQYADIVVNKRSGWKYKDQSGANLCAANPASVMEKMGSDYATNPVTQLKWCHDYYYKRYNKPNNWEIVYQFMQQAN